MTCTKISFQSDDTYWETLSIAVREVGKRGGETFGTTKRLKKTIKVALAWILMGKIFFSAPSCPSHKF